MQRGGRAARLRYYYICVLILLYSIYIIYICPHTATVHSARGPCGLFEVLLVHMCPHTAISIPSCRTSSPGFSHFTRQSGGTII